MKYALIIDNIVVQVQPNEQEGFVEVSDDVACGMIKEGDIFVNPIITKTLEEIEKEETIKLKEEKTNRLNSIVVTTSNNNSFDGNESARSNMLSAIISSETLSMIEDTWKLADNTQKLISLVELKEALALSILEVGKIVREYE